MVSVGLEAQIATLKEDKAKLLGDILEAERQVLMWEKKIQLEKETQDALDPTVRYCVTGDCAVLCCGRVPLPRCALCTPLVIVSFFTAHGGHPA